MNTPLSRIELLRRFMPEVRFADEGEGNDQFNVPLSRIFSNS